MIGAGFEKITGKIQDIKELTDATLDNNNDKQSEGTEKNTLSFKEKVMCSFGKLKQRIHSNNREDTVRTILSVTLPMIVGTGISLAASGAALPIGLAMVAIGLVAYGILVTTRKPDQKPAHEPRKKSLCKELKQIELSKTAQLLAHDCGNNVNHIKVPQQLKTSI